MTKAAPEAIDYIFTRKDSCRSPDAMPDIASIQAGIDSDVKLGVVPRGVTVSPEYVDLSLVEEAKRRIDGK